MKAGVTAAHTALCVEDADISAEGVNIILMGKPGVGKTHLAHAIGLEAIKRGKIPLRTHQ